MAKINFVCTCSHSEAENRRKKSRWATKAKLFAILGKICGNSTRLGSLKGSYSTPKAKKIAIWLG